MTPSYIATPIQKESRRHQWAMHTDTLCVIPRVSVPLPGRQRCSVLQNRSSKATAIAWIYDGNVDIDFYTNAVSSAYQFWSLSICGIRCVSDALWGRWRCSILQQSVSQWNAWLATGRSALQDLRSCAILQASLALSPVSSSICCTHVRQGCPRWRFHSGLMSGLPPCERPQPGVVRSGLVRFM